MGFAPRAVTGGNPDGVQVERRDGDILTDENGETISAAELL